MKTRSIKKLLTSALAIIIVMSFSVQSYASSCLDVRDYGDHRYAQRVIWENVMWQESFVLNGVRYTEGLKRILRECVCGAQKVFEEEFFIEEPLN